MKSRRFWHHSIIATLCLSMVLLFAPNTYAANDKAIVDEVRDLLLEYHYSSPTAKQLSGERIEDLIDAVKDPYTEYFTPEEWGYWLNMLEQTFVGIGIYVAEEDGKFYVADLIKGSYAEQAGLLAGDRIQKINGQSLDGLSLVEMLELLSSHEDTYAVIGVLRYGKAYQFRVLYGPIASPSAQAHMLGEGIGYLELSSFSTTVYKEAIDELAQLEKKGINALIIDLRNNGGGYTYAAEQVASFLMPDGVLYQTKDRDGYLEQIVVDGTGKNYPIVMMMNEYTASASELLAGALQDHGVAKLVGTRSYGKGLVQWIVPLTNGGMLKLTVLEYLTPDGHAVDRVGLTPDLNIQGGTIQLIESFRYLGGKQITMVAGKGVTTVNGVYTGASTDAAFKNNKGIWQVNMRAAASLLGATVHYDSKAKMYAMTRGTEQHTIAADAYHIAVRNQSAYIDVRMLKKWFPDMRYTISAETLKLISNGASESVNP